MPDPRVLLVVDDDDALTSAVARVFERRGWAVQRARNGSEAVAMVRGAEPAGYAAAIVDLVLPGAGGFDVVRELRARQPACRIVGVTGFADLAMTEAFRQAGADAFVGKPFEIAELVGAVEV
jgi:DNA-binding response OmpR family regulator